VSAAKEIIGVYRLELDRGIKEPKLTKSILRWCYDTIERQGQDA